MALHVSNGARRANGSSVNGRTTDRAARLAELMEDREFLQAYCERILGDAAAAEDMVQDTYLQAFRHLDRLEQRDSYRPWLATVALHRCRNEIRRRSRVSPSDDIPERDLPPEGEPEHAVLCDELLTETIAALGELSTREQELIWRQSFDDVSIVELALEDGSTPASVKSVLWRARSKVREILGETGHRALLPAGAALACVRRNLVDATARFQHLAPFAGGIERMGEAVVAAVAVLALGPAPVPAGAAPAPTVTPSASLAAFGSPFLAEAGGETEDEPDLVGPASADPAPADPAPPDTVTTVSPAPEPDDRPSPISERIPDPRRVDEHTPEPRSPTPRDESDDPEGAFFEDVVWVGGESAPAGQHVFALGAIRYRCDIDCTVLFHSADGGATWTKLTAEGVGDGASDLMVSPAFPDDPRIFVMTPSGLRRSSDGGHTFTPTGEPHAGPVAMSPDFARGDERILVGAGPGWVYDAANDVMRPFRPGAFPTPNHIHFEFAPGRGDVVFAGHFVHGEGGTKAPVVTRCDADGCRQRTPLPGSTQPPKVYVPPGFDETGRVVAWHDGGVFRSDDGGATLERAELRLAPGTSAHVEAVTGDADGTLYLAWWDIDDGSKSGGVLRSDDRGGTWHWVGKGTELDDGIAHVSAGRDGNVMATLRRWPTGGIRCSIDHGATWLSRCPVESP